MRSATWTARLALLRFSRETPAEAWLTVGIFWTLGAIVFYQFFTRYVLNNSASWTEEIARYFLIAMVFVGAAIGVGKNNHIQVDFFYKFMPARMARLLSITVDWVRAAFFATAFFATTFFATAFFATTVFATTFFAAAFFAGAFFAAAFFVAKVIPLFT